MDMLYLWEMWLKMGLRRDGNAGLSYLEMSSWLSLYGVALEPWEVEALDGLEKKFLDRFGRTGGAK